MPTLKIQPAKPLNPKLGLPWFAEIHTLMLCDQHITTDTYLKITNDEIPQVMIERNHVCFTRDTNAYTYTIHFDENMDLSDLPSDLRDCITFAANEGYNSIVFEPCDPDGMQPIEYLKTYTD